MADKDNVIRIDICEEHNSPEDKAPETLCCAKCPYCQLSIRLHFFTKHVQVCRVKFSPQKGVWHDR